ncbi:hypothetical protein M8J77_012946 [Diaphorina citri]|nr:hypothetical protein M8J77_012946 [Diaphorina citri]
MSKDQPSTSKDQSLNLTSEQIDPLKCLYSKNVTVPNQKAPLYDNLSKFSINEEDEVTIKPTVVKPKPVEPTVYDRAEIRSTLVESKGRTKKNVLTKLESITRGPLLALKNCMIQKIPVKVITRNHSSVRGYCTGIIILFDKHWNIALTDVREVWTRPKKKLKSIYMDTPGNEYQVKHRCCIPPVKILERTKKTELCERRMDQILIRGEQVVSVCALNYAEL